MFRDDDDREAFSDMIVRYLSASPTFDSRGRPYVNLRDQVRLFARNILTTHFHLAVEQLQRGGLEQLMQRVGATYTRRFNRKYGTSGDLFEERYGSRRIEDRKSFMWRIAYVNDNHKRLGVEYKFSTHKYFVDPGGPPGWLDSERALRVFGGRDAYLSYLSDREIRNRLDRELRG